MRFRPAWPVLVTLALGTTASQCGGTVDADDWRDVNKRCSLDAPFGRNYSLPGIPASAGGEFAPTLTSDELTVWYASPNSNAGTVQVARRASVNEPFANPKREPEIAPSSNTLAPSVTADGLTLYFVRLGSNDARNLRVASRATREEDFGRGVVPPGFGPGEDVIQSIARVSGDGMTLYYRLYRDGISRLYKRVFEGAAWGPAKPATELPEDANETVFSRDGLTVYFRRDSMPDSLWLGRRTGTDLSFDVARVEELSQESLVVRPGWLSDDACRLYFAAFAPNTPHMFVTRRGP